MRTIKARSWKEQVRSAETDQVHPAYRGYAYFARRRYFNKLSLLVTVTLAAFASGLFERTGIVLGVSLALFIGYLYLRARSAAEGLWLARHAPRKTVEREEIEICWEVGNRGGFPLRDVLLVDRFEGTQASRKLIALEPLPASTVLKGSYRARCDAGMGVFGFAPLTAVVSDPLGVFEFIVEEDEPTRIEVYPRIEQVPNVPVPGSKESFLYGIYDLPTRGTSVNFSGIRDYCRGDPLKHIAWRLSARHGRLLVKQFEKIANTEISVLLNMDERDHAGRKSQSTWEYSKDAALALIAQQMAHGNSIQLLSNKRQVDWGRGDPHVNLIARVIFGLTPTPVPDGRTLVEQHRECIPAASTAIYIGPLLATEPERLLRDLLLLRLKEVNVICVLVHPAGFLEGKVRGELKFLVDSSAWKTQSRLAEFTRRLRAEGITAHLLQADEPIGRGLLPSRGRAA